MNDIVTSEALEGGKKRHQEWIAATERERQECVQGKEGLETMLMRIGGTGSMIPALWPNLATHYDNAEGNSEPKESLAWTVEVTPGMTR
jgi:hypothetical protein